MPRANCVLCGGNAGHLNAEGSHNLCTELAKLNLPTPNLGTHCEVCNGNGHTSNMNSGGALYMGFDMGPRQISKTLAAAFPTCETCNGKGYLVAK